MKNHFEIFDFPSQFAIDLDLLEKKYLEFQRRFHPDKSGVAEIEKLIAVNEAYKVLGDDFLRACYLLELKGVDILKDERALKVDVETLARVLELQERIAEIVDKEEIKNLEEKLNVEIKFLINAAAKCLESGDVMIAGQFLVKGKYLKKAVGDLRGRKKEV